jgi:hypothetical protein
MPPRRCITTDTDAETNRAPAGNDRVATVTAGPISAPCGDRAGTVPTWAAASAGADGVTAPAAATARAAATAAIRGG